MDQLIPVINKLQDAFASVGLPGLDLPQIAVVGAQSSGKSSVLESIVGRDFLPRGSGIVTRRPLVLQLNHTERGSREYAQFLHLGDQKLHDFDQVRREIDAETERTVGANKGISPVPIHLKIFSPNVVNLTLIDLPGVTKVAVGDQPPDIEVQIRRMVLEFIARESCLILAVSPANSDIANSDALQLSRLVDPEGTRTIGVLTKLDLMDEGTHALDILMNKTLPLRHGYVGVVNRSQKEIDQNTKITSALEKEAEWFRQHPIYGSIHKECGTGFLQLKLKQTLIQHIQRHMPTLKSKLRIRLAELKKDLDIMNVPFASLDGLDMGTFSKRDSVTTQKILFNIIRNIGGTLKQLIDGHDGDSSHDIFSYLFNDATDRSAPIELTGSVRIKYIFQVILTKMLMDVESTLLSSTFDDEIRTYIHNVRGLRAGLYVPDAVFEVLTKKQIVRLEQPALTCIDMVHDELRRMICGIITAPTSPVRPFPKLSEWMRAKVDAMLELCKEPLVKEVKNLIKFETGYINTGHPDFVGNQGISKFIDQQQKVSSSAGKLDKSVTGLNDDMKRLGMGHKQGYLTKLGGTRKNWKKRWFVLLDSDLIFYESQMDRTEKGRFSLSGCIVQEIDEEEVDRDLFRNRDHLFEITTEDKATFLFRNHRTLYLSASTYQEKEEWIRAIQATIERASSIAASRLERTNTDENTTPNVSGPGLGKKPPALPPKPKTKPTSLSRASPAVSSLPDRLFATDLYASKIGSASLSPDSAVDTPSILTSDNTTITLTRVLLHSYFVIVRKHIQDLVPKAIMYMMVSRVKQDLPSLLMASVLECRGGESKTGTKNEMGEEADAVLSFLEESEETVNERKKKEEMYEMVQNAIQVIDREVGSLIS